MTKSKKKISDKVRSKKKDFSVKSNPFEIKVNKQKHDVLGQKRVKSTFGKPGVARSKGIKKREETLLVEYEQRGKSSKFFDKRFGENDPEMSLEDKMLQRFALEKQKHHEKASVFNLNDDDDDGDIQLTHFGQSLSEIENFDNPLVSDDEDDEDGRIDAKMVADEHFGGFLTLKQSDDNKDDKQLSWKERMEEAIAKSKKEKFERQSEKEKSVKLTEKLDKDWKELQGLVASSSKKANDSNVMPKPKADDYDLMIHELKYERKSTPSDRLKTVEEIAKVEKERLEKLEADRIRRMKGLDIESSNSTTVSHKSADDLDDGYIIDKKSKTVRFALSYNEGQLVQRNQLVNEDQSSDEDNTKDSDDGGSDVNEDDEDDNDDSCSDDEDDDKDDGNSSDDDIEDSQDKQDTSEKSCNVEETEVNDNKSEDESDDAMEHTSDLESDEESGDESDEDSDANDGKEEINKSTIITSNDEKSLSKSLIEKKKMMDDAKKELPFTFEAPSTFDQLSNLLSGHSDEDVLTIVERIQKCHHPSLCEGNKEKLQKLFELLLDYFLMMAAENVPSFRLLDKLTVHLYDLSRLSPISTGEISLKIIYKFHQDHLEYCENHSGRGVMPSLSKLLFFKLIATIFPTSDFKHSVITPAMLLMSEYLTQCSVNNRRDISSGLFLCSLFYEYVKCSERYVPEAINFLTGTLFLSIKKDETTVEKVIPPFKPFGKNRDFLLQKTQCKAECTINPVEISKVYGKTNALYLGTEDFRFGCIYQSIKLLQYYVKIYEKLPSFNEIFKVTLHFLKRLPVQFYPEKLQCLVLDTVDIIMEKESCTRQHLCRDRQPPKQIKMLEPKFEESFEIGKKNSGSRSDSEKKRLNYKVKKEMKGALREIRKDSQFLAQHKLQQQIEKDELRKRKVKEIYHHLSVQEGEVKKLKRLKDSSN